MLWDPYVFRRGNAVHELWERTHSSRPLKILYIAGRGFDIRAQSVMQEYVNSLLTGGCNVGEAKLLLVGFSGYELDSDIRDLTEENAKRLEAIFAPLGTTETITIGSGQLGDDGEEISSSNALRAGAQKVLTYVDGQTDITLDVSSLPRVAYLALLTSLLWKLVPNTAITDDKPHPLFANGVNFQVLVAEDAELDGHIKAEDPSSELVQLPGFAGAFHAESIKDWPLVWFPILGENRANQLVKVLASSEISGDAEICPVIPHPSKNPRRGDNLLMEYQEPLFKSGRTPTSNIVFVHESNPFEAYRQLLGAMKRYKQSLKVLGNCRLVVTPLGSKLITVGAGLACFEMRYAKDNEGYRVAIPLAEPKRYIAQTSSLRASKPDISALLLTGQAFASS
jgi:hypothetical protein